MGWRHDAHGVDATGAMSASSIADWRAAVESWLAEPASEPKLVAISIVLDARTIYGPARDLDVPSLLRGAHLRPGLLRLLLRMALASKPPTGFLRDIVVEHSGEHAGRFDIKRGGLLPIVNVARYAGLAAGATTTSTVERLRAAAETGTLATADAATLEEAFELFCELRLEHQAGQLEGWAAARRPDRPDDPEQAHPPLPARCLPGRRVGAEIAPHQARVEQLSDAHEVVDRSPVEAYLRTPMPEPATPWRQAGLCVLDLETTGLDVASPRDHRLRDDSDRRRSGPGPGHAQPPRAPAPDARAEFDPHPRPAQRGSRRRTGPERGPRRAAAPARRQGPGRTRRLARGAVPSRSHAARGDPRFATR